MAELTTIARPYAKAAFDFAAAKGTETIWSQYLAKLVVVVSDEFMIELLKNPSVNSLTKASMLVELTGGVSIEGIESFIESLSHYGRLLALPAIAVEFERLVASDQGAMDVTITSAYPLLKSEVALLESKLKARYSGKSIRVETTVDQSLIGGFEIRSRDTVIDASIRSRLAKVAASLAV